MAANDATVLTRQAFLELRREVLQLRRLYANAKTLGSTGQTPRSHQSVWGQSRQRIKFRNDSGEEVPAYAVMRITGANSDGYLTIGKPNTTFSRVYLVNTDRTVSVDGYGYGTFLTSEHFNQLDSKVLYESGTPAYGESWGPANGQWSLKKWRYGFTILGGNDTTALTTYAVQSPVNHVWGQTDGAITKGSAGTVEVYDGNDAQITSTNLTSVKNKFANVADNKKVAVSWFGGSWYLVAAEC